MEELSDRELLDMFANQATRNHAFNLLVQQYQRRIYFHIRKIVIDHDDSDDIMQNVFLKAYKALDKFREDSKISTWLYKIATNESITFLNSKKRRAHTPMEGLENTLSQNLESDSYFTGNQIQMKLQQAILTLPEKQRLVFNLKYFEEMKYEEMSEILGTSVGALKASYHHAVKKIELFIKSL
jgi:RNA polymerase sigma factor (sigma-70 family)